MSRRLLIAMILSASIIVGLTIASSFLKPNQQTIYALVSVLFLLYVALYVFFGLAKLIVFFIYGVFIAIALTLIPDRFSVILMFIGALVFVLNPLAELETFLEQTLSEAEIQPIEVLRRGKYQAFYQYRKEMKEHYHLPQMRKLFTKTWYKQVRTLSVLILFGIDIFIILFVATDIAYFQVISANNILGIYFLIIIFIMMFLLHKKGFTTMMRIVRLSVFVPIIFILAVQTDIDTYIKWIFISVLIVFGIVLSIIELVKYYLRVSYSAYQYYDQDLGEQVYANALFEPLVYNDNTTLIGHFALEVSIDVFQSHFNEILIYANFKRFIITAYTHNKRYAYIFAEFHPEQAKLLEKFRSFLESLFKTHVGLREYDDQQRRFYEKRFFHHPEYIVARALKLAHLLNDLEIRGELIISMVTYYQDIQALKAFDKMYPSRRLVELDQENVFVLQTNVSCRILDNFI